MWEAALVTLQLLTFTATLWVIREYVRVKRQLENIRRFLLPKRMDDLIDEMLENGATTEVQAPPATSASVTPPSRREHRERHAAMAAGGQSGRYLGKALSVEQVDSLGEDEVEKLYARYEARLGADMTRTLGRAAIQLYAAAASMLLPIPPENLPPLMTDLEDDPLVNAALTSAACELYHRYGTLLAPVSAAMTTARHCRFGHQCPRKISDGGDPGEQGRDGREGDDGHDRESACC